METSPRRAVGLAGGAVLVVALLVAGLGAAYFAAGYGPDEAALSAVEADDEVAVEPFDGGTVVRSGPVTEATTGLAYYPGGRVEGDSYVPTAAGIVEGRNVVVVVLEMPLNLAVLSPGRADAAREAVPGVGSWYVGGHSLGGAMACRYAADNAAALEGLVLHAAYCDRDLSGTDLRALSVVGGADEVIDRERERAGRALLPEATTVVELEGVTHSGFGAYGPQRGESDPPRDPTAMRADVAETTGRWLADG